MKQDRLRGKHLGFALAAVAMLGANHASPAEPLGSAFTYQGRLKQSGTPLTGTVEMVFDLYDDPDAGSLLGSSGPLSVPVTNGLFTWKLDFGAEVFNSEVRWLKITIDGAPLIPRQEITPTPYALQTRGIFVDDADNVGIGTTAPDHPLDVAGDVRGHERVAFGNDAAIGQGGTWNPDNARVFDFSHEITDFSLNDVWEAFRSGITINPPAGEGNLYVTGHVVRATVPPENVRAFNMLRAATSSAIHWGSGRLGEVVGTFSIADTLGSGGADVQLGHRVWSLVQDEGSIDENFGVAIVAGRLWDSTGSITRNIGLFVGEPGFTAKPGEPQLPLTNNYGIYLENQDFGENDSYAIYSDGGDTYLNGGLEVTGAVRGHERVAFGNEAAFDLGGSGQPEQARVFDFSHRVTDFSLSEYWTPFLSKITLDPTVDLTDTYINAGHNLWTTVASGNTHEFWGMNGFSGGVAHSGTGNIGSMTGCFLGAAVAGGGSVTNQSGVTAASVIQFDDGGSVTSTNTGIGVLTGIFGDQPSSIATNRGLIVWTPGTGTAGDKKPDNNYGIYLEDQDVGVNDSFAIYSAGGNWYLNGDLEVTGTISKGGGSFKIDHPLDPQNKYLYHSFVESPDMMNVYNGNVLLDARGEAVVTLPDWFEALNAEFRYQLTCLGGFAPVYVAQKINGNHFKIAGGTPGLEVSWQVTGIRHDPFAQTHRIPVEEDKPPYARGYYLHPQAHGAPKDRHVQEARRAHLGISPSDTEARRRVLEQMSATHRVAPTNR